MLFLRSIQKVVIAHNSIEPNQEMYTKVGNLIYVRAKRMP